MLKIEITPELEALLDDAEKSPEPNSPLALAVLDRIRALIAEQRPPMTISTDIGELLAKHKQG